MHTPLWIRVLWRLSIDKAPFYIVLSMFDRQPWARVHTPNPFHVAYTALQFVNAAYFLYNYFFD